MICTVDVGEDRRFWNGNFARNLPIFNYKFWKEHVKQDTLFLILALVATTGIEPLSLFFIRSQYGKHYATTVIKLTV